MGVKIIHKVQVPSEHLIYPCLYAMIKHCVMDSFLGARRESAAQTLAIQDKRPRCERVPSWESYKSEGCLCALGPHHEAAHNTVGWISKALQKPRILIYR